jgi:hypothetical protein
MDYFGVPTVQCFVEFLYKKEYAVPMHLQPGEWPKGRITQASDANLTAPGYFFDQENQFNPETFVIQNVPAEEVSRLIQQGQTEQNSIHDNGIMDLVKPNAELLLHLEVWEAGDYYNIESLKSFALAKIVEITREGLSLNGFYDVVSKVFPIDSQFSAAIRDIIAEAAARTGLELPNHLEFNDMMLVGDFAYYLVSALTEIDGEHSEMEEEAQTEAARLKTLLESARYAHANLKARQPCDRCNCDTFYDSQIEETENGFQHVCSPCSILDGVSANLRLPPNSQSLGLVTAGNMAYRPMQTDEPINE